MNEQLLGRKNVFKDAILPYTSIGSRKWDNSMKDVWVYTSRIVNLYYVKNTKGELVMVDAGMPHDAGRIKSDFKKKFGDVKPVAIILTHGHFDHVGSLAELVAEWKVPVYAHPAELPYLTGVRDYPEGKASKKGLVTVLSKTFPNHGINMNPYIHPLPEDHKVPYLEGWEWIFTPGHTPGHVSLYNPDARLLLAGDAFVTTKQESLFHVLTQKFDVNGPPAYFTIDFEESYKSIERLSRLNIEYCATGHGRVIKSKALIKSEMEKLLKKDL